MCNTWPPKNTFLSMPLFWGNHTRTNTSSICRNIHEIMDFSKLSLVIWNQSVLLYNRTDKCIFLLRFYGAKCTVEREGNIPILLNLKTFPLNSAYLTTIVYHFTTLQTILQIDSLPFDCLMFFAPSNKWSFFRVCFAILLFSRKNVKLIETFFSKNKQDWLHVF